MTYLPLAPIALGLFGSLLELTGNPKLVALGKRLESLGLDLPKLLGRA
jgi:hypothetical protein